MTISIRPETAADIPIIEALTAAAFLNAQHTSHTEQFIVNALRAADQLTLSLVAEEESKVVGHIAVSPITISNERAQWYGLGPVSVSPERQGQGIGSGLIRQALAELRRLGAAGCVVLGDPHYYGRFGFTATSNLVLPGVPPEYFQAILLNLNATSPTGVVSYHEAFNASPPTSTADTPQVAPDC
ncbi:MAG TPA: N-acetyltransferase [Candidimonas sp.]|nr:N-acetyltransferase [Candidimonas sp.]